MYCANCNDKNCKYPVIIPECGHWGFFHDLIMRLFDYIFIIILGYLFSINF